MSNYANLTKAKEKILYKWYKNDYKGTSMIANFVNKEIKKIGGISQKDHDNFHSLANEVFFKSLKTLLIFSINLLLSIIHLIY